MFKNIKILFLMKTVILDKLINIVQVFKLSFFLFLTNKNYTRILIYIIQLYFQ
jgi:hypothetical protein